MKEVTQTWDRQTDLARLAMDQHLLDVPCTDPRLRVEVEVARVVLAVASFPPWRELHVRRDGYDNCI